MDWGTLLAVLLGGLLAFGSQWAIERRLDGQRDRTALVNACADFIASCENQRNQEAYSGRLELYMIRRA